MSSIGRITHGMMNAQMLRNLNTNLNKMNDYQTQMATGRRINKPSDDPVGITFALRYRTDLAANEQYTQNVSSALSWLEFSDTMLNQSGNVLHRVRELAVQGASSSNPQGAMDAIRLEVNQLAQQLTTIGNSQFNGKYVFNGQITDQEPYSRAITQVPVQNNITGNVDVSNAVVTAANNGLTLVIDNELIQVTLPPKDYANGGGAAAFAVDLAAAINNTSVNAKVEVKTNDSHELTIVSTSESYKSVVEITGGSLASTWLSLAGDLTDLTREPAANGIASYEDIEAKRSETDYAEIHLEVATGVKIPINITGKTIFGSPDDSDNVFAVMNDLINALDQNKAQDVSTLLGRLDSRLNQVLQSRADLGAKINRVELAEERLKDININLNTLKTKTEDADMAELITQLKTYENVYQASLSVGARIIRPSLIDFLR